MDNSLDSEMERLIARTEGGQRTFFDVHDFSWVVELESHWRSMREELDGLLLSMEKLPGYEEIEVGQGEITEDKRWKIFPLYVYGHWSRVAQRLCPKTLTAIKGIPDIQAAMFSILQGNKELPMHRGPYSGVLRYHLGLKIPTVASSCGISIGADSAQWEEGKSLIFDDTHLHRAWNLSNEDRVVLFVDFTRPLPAHLKTRNAEAIAGFSRTDFMVNAEKRWRKWEAKHWSAEL